MLAAALEGVIADWGFVSSYTLKDLLGSWRATVEGLEGGYRLSLSDYELDLALRDEIETVKTQVPLALRDRIDAFVNPFDKRFEAATREVDHPVLPGLEGDALAWWWYREPTLILPDEGDDSWTNALTIPPKRSDG